MSKEQCYNCLVAGAVVTAVTIVVVVIVICNTLGCDVSTCGMFYAVALMMACGILAPLGIVSTVLRYTRFSSRQKSVPADGLKMLKAGQRLLIVTPWAGVLLICIFVAMKMIV